MAPSSTEIKGLLTSERYNPSIIPQLESYLVSQVESNGNAVSAYDFEANRTLVKLYQFFPALANLEYRNLAALLAIVYGNDAEFGAINCLIPEIVKAEEPFPSLIAAVQHRDACLFSNLWTTIASMESSSLVSIANLVKSNHAKTALRTSILNTLSLTFKSTTLASVLTHLNLESEAQLNAMESDAVETVLIRGAMLYFAIMWRIQRGIRCFSKEVQVLTME